jgi:hypothetical protein
MSIVNSKLAVQQNLYDQTRAQYEQIAKNQQLNPANVTTNLTSGASTSTSVPATQAAALQAKYNY